MERMFKEMHLGSLKLSNRFVFPPIKLAYGNPDGTLSDRQLVFYRQIAQNGPGLSIMEPVAVTQDGKEHPSSLPEKPQMDALAWVRGQVSLPLIVAGRMGREEKIQSVQDNHLADLVALGRPLIACPGLIEAWRKKDDNKKIYCGYCIQGCLPRVRTAEGIGCNINPAVGRPELTPSPKPMKVLVAGGGPAGMSAAYYLSCRGLSEYPGNPGAGKCIQNDIH